MSRKMDFNRRFCHIMFVLLFNFVVGIVNGQSEGSIEQRPVKFDTKEWEEDDTDNKGLLGIDTFKETLNSLFGGEPMRDEQNKCQDENKKRSDTTDKEENDNEFINSMKEDFDKWNNMIDSMSTSDYDLFSEMFGGTEGNEENKIEIS